MMDRLWEIALAMPVFLGGIVNGYKKTKQTYYENELFPYYDFELPDDRDCDDVENKRKCLHKFRKWGESGFGVLNFKKGKA